MGKGFGRGAKSVAIVTHAQAKGAKKMPKGLRTNKRKRTRQQYANAANEDAQMEDSLNGKEKKVKGGAPKSIAEKIASISVPGMIVGRKKGFKNVRREIMKSAKDIKRRHVEKNKKRKQQDERLLAEKHRKEQRRINSKRNKL